MHRNRRRLLIAAAIIVGALAPIRSTEAVGPDSVFELQVTGRAGIPADASAVTVNLTAVDAAGPGFATMYPCGEARPLASTLNYVSGSPVSNATTVKVGAGGKICLYALTSVQLIADVQGWFPAGADYEGMTPNRLLDTRPPVPASPPPSGLFVETFDNNGGLQRFATGVFHRSGANHDKTTTWPGDHNLACEGPETSRTLNAASDSNLFYMCKDHLMTSVGHVDAYSVAWFSPNRTFSAASASTVAWDVNVTDLGGRKWWEVGIVPANWYSGVPDCPLCSVISFLEEPAHLPGNPSGGVVFSAGISKPKINDTDLTWQNMCGANALDPEGCASKAIRRTFSITDNRNGTVTARFLDNTWTVPGSFPDQFKVVFKDHNYTPLKEGPIQGFTWHWDNIVVR
jgi:hypothetical protein